MTAIVLLPVINWFSNVFVMALNTPFSELVGATHFILYDIVIFLIDIYMAYILYTCIYVLMAAFSIKIPLMKGIFLFKKN